MTTLSKPLATCVSFAASTCISWRRETARRWMKMRGALSVSPVLDIVRTMDRRRALEVLDAILCGRVYTRDARRLEHRINAFTAYIQMGGAPLDVSLVELPEPDLFDVASNLGAREAASMTLEVQNAISADEDEDES